MLRMRTGLHLLSQKIVMSRNHLSHIFLRYGNCYNNWGASSVCYRVGRGGFSHARPRPYMGPGGVFLG